MSSTAQVQRNGNRKRRRNSASDQGSVDDEQRRADGSR